MPLYEYRCSECGKVFEVIQKFSDAPLTVHEGCGGHVERLLSAPALQFKGSGWYVTDYAKSPSGDAASKGEGKDSGKTSESKSGEAKAGAKPSGSESKKTESKPAATSTKSE